MADKPHKSDVLDQMAISAFIRQLSARPEGLVAATGLSYGTVEKWYRPKPSEMSAANLLRVVFALGAEERFVNQVREWRATIRQGDATAGVTYDQRPNVPRQLRVAEPGPIVPAAPSEKVRRSLAKKTSRRRRAAGE